jgi:hypothetical protein
MTSKADFNPEEWDLVLEGPPSAGLIVSMAERGGTFREAFSIAKAYTEARQQHGESQLLDEIVNAKPEVDRSHKGSPEEIREYLLGRIREAAALLEDKATTEEVGDYRSFALAVAERVAAAKKEGDEPVSEAERAAIDEIRSAVGAGAG